MRPGSLLGLTLVLPLVLATAPAARQTTTPLFRMNCTPDNMPTCGFGGAVPGNPYHRVTPVPNGGPQGQPAVQFDILPTSADVQFAMGYYLGTPAPEQGAKRFIRLLFKMVAWDPRRAWTNKFIIVGDGSDGGTRVIIELGPHTDSRNRIQTSASRNIDGYPGRTQPFVTIPTVGDWHYLQYELASSSTAGASDGRLAIWLDQANYAKPSSVSGAISLRTSAGNQHWGNVALGYFSNETVPIGGRVAFQIAGFEYDDEFDPNWRPTAPPRK